MNNCELLLEAFSAQLANPAYRAIAGVLDGAAAGALPGFGEWLGLSEEEYWAMLDTCFPGARDAGWEPSIAISDATIPCEFQDLIDMLEADRSSNAVETRWLAHALACGCFGGNHLWHDMGLSGREDVTVLLQRYFRPVFDSNTNQMKWKKFFYHRICERMDLHPCPEPVCTDCDNYAVCYGSEKTVIVHRVRRGEE